MNDTFNLTARDQLKVLMRLLTYTFPFKGIIALAFIMLILSTVAGMIIPYLVMVFIDDYLTPAVFPEGEITMLVAVYLIVQIIGAITTYMNIYLFQYLAFKVIQQLRIDAFNKIGKLGMKYFDKVPGGSIVSRLTNDTEAIVEMFIGVFATFLMALFMMASSYVMMFVLDVRLAFMALIFMPLIFLIMLIYRKYSAIFFSHARQLLSDLIYTGCSKT